MMKHKFGFKQTFFALMLAVAGLFGVSATIVDKQDNLNVDTERANAAASCLLHGYGMGTNQSDCSWNWKDYTMTYLTGTTYKVTVYCYDYADFCFNYNNGTWLNYVNDHHYGAGVSNIYNENNNYKIRLTAGLYDIYLSYSNGSYQEIYVEQKNTSTKIVKFYKDGGSWSPTKIHYFISGCDHVGTSWPGVSLSTNYGSTEGLYYIDNLCRSFNGYVINDGNSGSNHQSFNISGSTSKDEELYFFNGTTSKDSSDNNKDKYNIYAGSTTKTSGYYIFGNSTFCGSVGGAWNIIGAIKATSTGSGNLASWSSVSFSVGAEFKLCYYHNDTGVSDYQNNGWGDSKAETVHGWFTWEDNKDVHSIVCNTTGSYKVFLNNSAYTYINKDFTIKCYEIVHGVASESYDEVVGNSDELLSVTLAKYPSVFADKDSLEITGYYSDTGCSSSIAPGTYYPDGDTLSIYAKYEPKYSVIAGNKVRVWVRYATANPLYNEGVIKVWTHSAVDGGTTGGVYGATGTWSNTQESGRRYDYFDINLSDYTNGYYISVQRLETDKYAEMPARTTEKAIKLSSTNVGKVLDLWGDWSVSSVGTGTITIATDTEITGVDQGMAALALCGLHTCLTTNSFNGRAAFNNFYSTFAYKTVSSSLDTWKINGDLSSYYIYDFEKGDTSYGGSVDYETTARHKYDWLYYYAKGGPMPSPGAVSGFSPFNIMGEDSNSFATIIIIVASSVSLLSITALSVLVIKKRKEKQ